MTAAHAFMGADVLQSLAAVCLFPLFALVPGYVLAWLTDLFEFRRRTTGFQLALSVPLSIAICPILIYLAGHFVSMAAVWTIFAIVWLCFLVIAVRRFRSVPRLSALDRPFALLAVLWAVVALCSLIDLQWGPRIYFSTVALDYSVRTEFIHSITATGIPPANPFFYPGHPVPLRYHYFWLLMCSLVEQAGGSTIGPRAAWIAGAIWCGIALIAMVTLYFRLVWYHEPSGFRRRSVLGVALLGVTGLDIIPNLGLWVLYGMGMPHAVQASGDWWNEQVAGFLSTALWEAHYLAGLICCLTAFLVLWAAPGQRSPARRILYGAIGGAALASATGSAIYVAFVFAVFLALWTLVSLQKRWWWETAVLAIAGIAAILLVLPYVHELSGPASGGPPLQLWVRPFSAVDTLFRGSGSSRDWKLHLVNAIMLPLNYFLELGVFFVAAIMWWRNRRSTGKPLDRAEIAIALMVGSSLVICTFVRSSVIGNNDLGWRGILIAQFGLLVWTADLLAERRTRFLTVLLALGVLGNVYDLLMLRFYPAMADAAVVSTAGWIAPDRQAGRRTYAAREAYQWAARSLPAGARLQFNPHVILQATDAFLYSGRQIVAGDEGCMTGFGGNPDDCPAIMQQLKRFYPDAGQSAPPSIAGLCRSLPVDLLVVKDLDAVWNDRQSWVWKETPLFANGYFRLYGCATR
jgi:hypothetical protein